MVPTSKRGRNKRRTRLAKKSRRVSKELRGWHRRMSMLAWQANHPREMAMFLGANSIYGKYAQVMSNPWVNQ